MADEEELKKRLLQQRLAEQSQMAQQIAMKNMIEAQVKMVMLKVLEPKARERLSNLKIVKPELAQQLELYIFQLYQAGQVKKITDSQMVIILQKLSGSTEFRIKRK